MRTLRRLDAFQQGHRPFAFVFGILKKYGDDNGGVLVSNISYSAVVALFPLLLALVTVLGTVLAGHPALQQKIDQSVISQFPGIGSTLLHNVHALNTNSSPGFVIGFLGSLYGSLGVSQAGIYAMGRIWGLPSTQKPDFVHRLGRSVAFLGVIGLGLILTTAAAGIGTFGKSSILVAVLGELLAFILNILQYILAFRVLTAKSIETRELIPGSVVGAFVWTILQAAGGYLVGHQLRHSQAVYGVFGIAIGLLAWIYLGARVTLYAAEINAVLHHRLWPRGLVQPPLTEADKKALRLQAQWAEKRPESHIEIHFSPSGEDQVAAERDKTPTKKDNKPDPQGPMAAIVKRRSTSTSPRTGQETK